MTTTLDICIAWEWKYDKDFIALLRRNCLGCGLSTCVVDPGSLAEIERAVASGELAFRAFFDRASDTNPAFVPLAAALGNTETLCVNPLPDVERAIDKAAMHHEFSIRGIDVPRTIILPVFRDDDPAEALPVLGELGVPFIIKPAHGGGGLGVLVGARSLAEVQAARMEFRHDRILVQENIVPRLIEGRKAWFRAYYAGGDTLLCWWDPQRHIYERVTTDEAARWGLGRMEAITREIRAIARLNFFSTEIALTDSMRWVSVDYVNDQCDMRFKSRTPEGVPDDVEQSICGSLARFVAREVCGKTAAPPPHPGR